MGQARIETLASYLRCVERIRGSWSVFTQRRREQLAVRGRYGTVAERVTEEILRDLFTLVLDCPLSALNYQIDYADILLTDLGAKYLIVEAKRDGSLAWNERAVKMALNQAQGYAARQKVRCVGISDGVMLYAGDVVAGGLRDRAFVSLAAPDPPLDLWWISVHGIYRDRTDATDAGLRLLPEPPGQQPRELRWPAEALLHPKYGLPANCFAYVGDASSPETWKLPYIRADGRAIMSFSSGKAAPTISAGSMASLTTCKSSNVGR
jgi:hypothetical protein